MTQKRERIVTRLIDEEIRESFLDYSMSVIVQRALPDVRDGLKPVHRRILYAMHELGLRPDRPFKKSAAVVGEVLGKFHPHGDSSVYEALVRMVQTFSLRYPLISGQGNFGSIDGDSAAAYRYTEARLAPVAMDLLEEIERETVAFTPNFDGQREEPTVLPAALPNLLLNGSSGIAVGMSTNIPPHNLREIAAAVRLLLDRPECTVDELMEVVPGPDFPTGGFIVGNDGIRKMFETGRGRIVMRARVVKEVLRGGRERLVVTEIPYGTSKQKIIEQIADLHRKGRLDDVSDIRDESDRDGMRLLVELKRGGDPERVLRSLFRRTQLQSTFGAILLALHEGEPQEFSFKKMLEKWRDHRLEVIQRRSRHDLEKAEAERHVTEGLLLALDRIDEVIALIRASRNRAAASEGLQSTFGLSEAQAEAILSMRLVRLTRLESRNLLQRMEELLALITMLRGILASEERQKAVLREELDRRVEEYGDPRRTVILADASEDEAQVEDAVADEAAVVLVSHEGFIQRMPVHLYRRRVESGRALAGMDRYESDFIERVFIARSRGWVLAFTESGKVHFLSVLDIPEVGRSSRGNSVHGLVGSDPEDPIASLLPVEDLAEENVFLLFFSERGQIKRTALREYANPRAGGIIAAGVKEGDRILDAVLTDGSGEIILFTRAGRAIRFPEGDVPLMGRTAQGVKGVDLRPGDRVVGTLLVRRYAEILTITGSGIARRIPVTEFPIQKRGGLGTLAVPTGVSEQEPLIAALEVLEEEEIMALTEAGVSVPIPVRSVPRQGRRGRGAPLVRMAGKDRVVRLTRSGANRDAGEGPPSSGEEESRPLEEERPSEASDAPPPPNGVGEETDVGEEPEEEVARGPGTAASQLDLLGD